MGFNVFIIAAIVGLAMVLLLLVGSRMGWQFTGRLCKFTYIVASLVGVALIIAALAACTSGGANAAEAIRNSLYSTEYTLRHWFQSLSLR